MSEYDLTVIIPTYNEEKNIHRTVCFINAILDQHDIRGEILIIDDNSTDETHTQLQDLANTFENVRYIIRKNNRDLAQAIEYGFKNTDSDIICVTDADLSHEIEKIPDMYHMLRNNECDIVIGSRYMPGGKTVNWPLNRKVISWGANVISHVIFPYVSDSGGFFALKQSVVDDINFKSRGYKIILDIIDKGRWTIVKDIPYTFTNRKEGRSKMKISTMIDYVLQIIAMTLNALLNRNTQMWNELQTIARFTTIGGFCIFVNLGLLFFLTSGLNIFYLLSGLIATETSIVVNFILNDTWSFRGKKTTTFTNRLKTFHMVSFGGLLINMTALFTLTSIFGFYYIISGVIAIGITYGWNLSMNRRHTWG